MTVGELKEILSKLPNEGQVLYRDPNFGGPYHRQPEYYDFEVTVNDLLISFPFETPVD